MKKKHKNSAVKKKKRKNLAARKENEMKIKNEKSKVDD